ncbi:MAG: sulfatase-like hydrolase/transferase [Proteobacteria bacterium]|nr:sulfatase-like hydrolase/transferase [Pseudomonadota bacterium]
MIKQIQVLSTKRTKRTFIDIVIFFLFCWLLTAWGCNRSSDSANVSTKKSEKPAIEKKAPVKRPNVLLLTIDTLRADHLSSYGYPRRTSPNLDTLAKEGVLFKNAMCNWPKTTPSFASMLTGTYGRTNRVRGGCGKKLPMKFTTIAEVMLENGYRTGAVVNNANLGVEFQFNQGFQDHIEIWREPMPKDCVTVTDQALKWLKQNHKQDFFLWVHYISPHTQYRPAPPYDKMFVKDKMYNESPDRKLRVRNTYHKAIHKKNAYLEPHRNFSYYISQYDGEIAYVDSQAKRIFEALKELGVFEDTLIIISSDHGEELGEHGSYFEHGKFAYQTTMHVPLIISYPRHIPAGGVINNNLTLIDLFPTIVDYSGITPGDYLEGTSLRRFIDKKVKIKKRSVIYSEGGYKNRKHNRFHSVIYRNSWKLIHNSHDNWELYHLRKDPQEKRNVFDKSVKVATSLKKKLTAWESQNKSNGSEEKTDISNISEETKQQLKSLGYID